MLPSSLKIYSPFKFLLRITATKICSSIIYYIPAELENYTWKIKEFLFLLQREKIPLPTRVLLFYPYYTRIYGNN